MRLNAVGTKLAKKVVGEKPKFATCGEELAWAFTNCSRFHGEEFKPEGFKLGVDGLTYKLGNDYYGCQNWYFQFDDFADNCGILVVCGLNEIPGDPAIQAAIMRAIACAARTGLYGMLLASVNHQQKQARAMLEAFGMKPLMDLTNPNSSNHITLFGKDITGVKDTLGTGNGPYDQSARNWYRHNDD